MAREVTTDKIAHRLSRRLRAERFLNIKRNGVRGSDAAYRDTLDEALKLVRSGDVPAPKKSANGRKPYVKPLVNEFKGMKRKHRLRIRRGVA